MTIQPHDSAAANRATPSLKMVIGGEFVDAADGQAFDVVSPGTGHAILSVPKGGAGGGDRAVGAAPAAARPSPGSRPSSARISRSSLISKPRTWASPSPRPAGRSGPWRT